MKILKWPLIVIAVLVIVGFLLPDEVSIVRSTVIAAEPAAIHPHVATLKEWPEWSVWNKEEDPTAEFEFEGADSGVGAKWKWKGDKFQEGTLAIVESDPSRGVRYALEMSNGFQVDGDIAFEPAETGGTKVTWTDKGRLGMGPLGGWMRMFLAGTIDAEQGANQEKGLESLKRRVEGGG